MKINSLFTYLLIIIFSPIIGKLINEIIEYYKAIKEYKSDESLLTLVNRLTPKEFQIWCAEYLSYLGYVDIIIKLTSNYIGKDIICSKNNHTIYVECKKYDINTNISEYDVEKLLGVMITDNVKEGIIITTGGISSEANALIEKLKPNFSIIIICKEQLSCSYNNYILQNN